MPNIYLYAGEANPNNIKLSDPTTLRGSTVDVLLANGITVSIPLGTPLLGQTHVLSGSNIVLSQNLGTPLLSQVFNLSPQGITISQNVGNPLLTEVPSAVDLIANSLVITLPTGTPSLGTIHNLVANSIAIGGLSSADLENIAAAVWEYMNQGAPGGGSLSQDDLTNIAAKVWEYERV